MSSIQSSSKFQNQVPETDQELDQEDDYEDDETTSQRITQDDSDVDEDEDIVDVRNVATNPSASKISSSLPSVDSTSQTVQPDSRPTTEILTPRGAQPPSTPAPLSSAPPPVSSSAASPATPMTKRSTSKVRQDILERRQQTQDIVYVKCADVRVATSNSRPTLSAGSIDLRSDSNLPSATSRTMTSSSVSPTLGPVSTPAANLSQLSPLHSPRPDSSSANLPTTPILSESEDHIAPIASSDEASTPQPVSDYWSSLAHDATLVNTLANRLGSLRCPRIDSEREAQLAQLIRLESKLEGVLQSLRCRISEHKQSRDEPACATAPSSCQAGTTTPMAGSNPVTQSGSTSRRLIAPGSSRLSFATPPSSVLVIKKPGPSVSSDFSALCQFLTRERGLTVYAERSVIENEFPEMDGILKPIDEQHPSRNIDFCITLGGDGTVLHFNSLFPAHQPIPPVLSFSLGSLGFLTPFAFSKHRKLIDDVLNAHVKSVYVCSRMRFRCTVYRLPQNEVYYKRHLWAVKNAVDPSLLPPYVPPEMSKTDSTNNSSIVQHIQSTAGTSGATAAGLPMSLSTVSSSSSSTLSPSTIDFNSSDTVEKKLSHLNQSEDSMLSLEPRKTLDTTELGIEVQTANPLNEVIIQRGLSTSLALLDLFVDGELTTTVRADGLIVSTPTGSTGYNMSTGGPMLAPSVPAMVISPVCPHNLAFRPIVVCDSSLLRIRVHPDMPPGQAVYASFDGRTPTPLYAGDTVRVSMESIRVPSIVKTEFNTEWFKSIKSKLHWNSALIPPRAHSTSGNSRSALGLAHVETD